MMKKRVLLTLLMLVIVLAVLGLFVFTASAPPLSDVEPGSSERTPESTPEASAQAGAAALPCLSGSAGTCLLFPTISGQAISGESFTAPAGFDGSYALVIVPFDREQQERAIDWLVPAQTLAADYAGLSFYSVAALPDLTPFVRTLVIGGLDVALRDPVLRAVTVVTFLSDQSVFVGALELPDTEAIAVLLLDARQESRGTVLWLERGDYSTAAESALRDALDTLYGRG